MSGAPIVGAVGVSASAVLPAGYGPPTALTNIIDQSGLSALCVSGVTDFGTYTAATTASYSCCYPELGGVAGMPASIWFDLGAPTSIDGMVIWNQAGFASLFGFDLLGSLNLGGPFTPLGSFGTSDKSQNFPQPAEVFSFGAGTYRYVELHITSNRGYSEGTILGRDGERR